jgi:hypothetical protein
MFPGRNYSPKLTIHQIPRRPEPTKSPLCSEGRVLSGSTPCGTTDTFRSWRANQNRAERYIGCTTIAPRNGEAWRLRRRAAIRTPWSSSATHCDEKVFHWPSYSHTRRHPVGKPLAIPPVPRLRIANGGDRDELTKASTVLALLMQRCLRYAFFFVSRFEG